MLFWYDNRVATPACRYNPEQEGFHGGIDVRTGEIDRKVYSTVAGKVVFAGEDGGRKGKNKEWGIFVAVQDKEGFRHYYCHLAHAAVKNGQELAPGYIVGIVGRTGAPCGEGDYVHYEVRKAPYEQGDTVDPTPWCGLANDVGVTWNHGLEPQPKEPVNKRLKWNLGHAEAEASGIQFYRSDNQSMNDAIDRLVVRVFRYREKYGRRSLLLTGSGSGNGTSMLSINLAIALSLSGWNTLLVDADLRKASRYKRLGRRLELGLSNYLENTAENNKIIYRTNYARMDYVPCGDSMVSGVRLLCSEGMGSFVEETKSRYDFIIFDTPSVTVVPDATVLFSMVDGIALVAALNRTTKKQLADAKSIVNKNAEKYYGLVVNQIDKKQYRNYFPQEGYFREERLWKKHKKWTRRERAAERKGEKG